jgi:hypothetical protein
MGVCYKYVAQFVIKASIASFMGKENNCGFANIYFHTIVQTPVVNRVYTRRRQPTARVPSVARGTIFNGTLSELKYSI